MPTTGCLLWAVLALASQEADPGSAPRPVIATPGGVGQPPDLDDFTRSVDWIRSRLDALVGAIDMRNEPLLEQMASLVRRSILEEIGGRRVAWRFPIHSVAADAVMFGTPRGPFERMWKFDPPLVVLSDDVTAFEFSVVFGPRPRDSGRRGGEPTGGRYVLDIGVDIDPAVALTLGRGDELTVIGVVDDLVIDLEARNVLVYLEKAPPEPRPPNAEDRAAAEEEQREREQAVRRRRLTDQIHAAQSLIGKGDRRKALEALRRVVNDHPDTPEAELAASQAKELDFSHRVLRVVDGTTLVVSDAGAEVVVGLLGVSGGGAEAPEDTLRGAVEGSRVHLAYPGAIAQVDRRGRRLAYVYRHPDQVLVNLEVVRAGAQVDLSKPHPLLSAFIAAGRAPR